MKLHYKLKVSFKGTRFLGWQSQRDSSPTVQDELNKVLRELFKSDQIKTIGSGRTDTGVHAKELIVKFLAPFEIPLDGLKKGVNTLLPADIVVNDCFRCEESFKPTSSAKRREYFYLFAMDRDLTPFEYDFIVSLKKKLDLERVGEACRLFIGEHDFINYMCVGSEVKSTVREIFDCKVEKIPTSFHGLIKEHYRISITGNGFLKQMIRLIVGAIWAYSSGKIDKNDIIKSLKVESKTKLAAVAPAKGLYKSQVEY